MLYIEGVDFNGNTHHATVRASAAEITEVFVNGPKVVRNRPGRAGSHIAIGATDGGRRLIVPFIYDERSGMARPITAWEDR